MRPRVPLIGLLLAVVTAASAGIAPSVAADAGPKPYRFGNLSILVPSTWKPFMRLAGRGRPYGTFEAIAPGNPASASTLIFETLPNATIRKRPQGSLKSYGPKWFVALKAAVPPWVRNKFRWSGVGLVRLAHLSAYRVQVWALDGAMHPLIFTERYLVLDRGVYYSLSFTAWNPAKAKRDRPTFSTMASSLTVATEASSGAPA
jgi:hypothetical protein